MKNALRIILYFIFVAVGFNLSGGVMALLMDFAPSSCGQAPLLPGWAFAGALLNMVVCERVGGAQVHHPYLLARYLGALCAQLFKYTWHSSCIYVYIFLRCGHPPLVPFCLCGKLSHPQQTAPSLGAANRSIWTVFFFI